MRFSSVTILAFIAYTSNQVLAAPIPHSSQAIETYGPHHKQHSRDHGPHGLTGHAKAHVPEDEEFAEPKNTDSSHVHYSRRRNLYYHHQDHDLEAQDMSEPQELQARNLNFRTCTPEKPCRFEGPKKRDLQVIKARSFEGDSAEHNEEPHDADAGPPHYGHHHHHHQHHHHNSVPAYAHDFEELQSHFPHGTGHPHHRGGHHHHHHHHHHQQHTESPAIPEAEEHAPDNSASGQSPGPAPSKRHLRNEDEDDVPVHYQHDHHNQSLRRVREKHTHDHGHAPASAYAEELDGEDKEAHEDQDLSPQHRRHHQKRELFALFARDLQEIETRRLPWK